MTLPRISMGEWLHLALTALWIALIPPTLLFWKDSVPFLVFISVYSVIIGHLSAFQAAKAERNSPDA